MGRLRGRAPRPVPRARVSFRRRRFTDVVRRQLELFEREQAALLAELAAAERAYDRAGGDDAEEAYGRYDELVDDGTELLADLRDAYAASLEDEVAADYAATFNGAARKRFPRLALELDGR